MAVYPDPVVRPSGLPAPEYAYDVNRLSMGASYGNAEAFIWTDAVSDLGGFWVVEDLAICGPLTFEMSAGRQVFNADRTSFAPSFQFTTFRAPGCTVEKAVAIPVRSLPRRLVHWRLSAAGESVPFEITVTVRVQPPGLIQVPGPQPVEGTAQTLEGTPALFPGAVIRPGWVIRDGTLLAQGQSPAASFAFGSNLALREVRDSKEGSILTYHWCPEGGREEAWFFLASAPEGPHGCLRTLARAREPLRLASLFPDSAAEMEDLLSRSRLITPDPVINRGVRWAKVNTFRVEHGYPAGPAFTNDPPRDILVIRDAAWFVLGSDYFTPRFSKGMLEFIAARGAYPDGKLAEYLHCSRVPPAMEDYGLNINDNTPLYIIAVHHHYAASGDRPFLERVYGSVEKAADWLLSQRRNGLIHCEARGTGVTGIASWRNIIPGLCLGGAVTEINCEAIAALRAAADLAREVGEAGRAAEFDRATRELTEAVNRELISNRGGYLLASPGGTPTDLLTGDLVFPVLFDVADPPRRRAILELLWERSLRTGYGSRTVAKGEPGYDPDEAYQLLGGVWPNLTAWIAYAGRNEHPERIAAVMRRLFRPCEAPRPASLGRLCPGQFPERFHGERLQSRGMPLSPWMPPTYLWLAVEGLAGLSPTVPPRRPPIMIPRPAPSWEWLALVDTPLRGQRLTAVFHEGRIYSNMPLETPFPLEVFDEVKMEMQETSSSAANNTAVNVNGPCGPVATTTLRFKRKKEIVTFEAEATGHSRISARIRR